MRRPAPRWSARIPLALCCCALVVGAGLPRIAAADALAYYTVVDLGPADGVSWSHGLAIGATGLVAGAARGPDAAQAFRGAPDGTMQLLGSLAGPRGQSRGAGINGGGVVVGTSDYGQGMRRAFRFDGAMVDLGVLPGGSWSEAVAINDAGVIAGHGDRADGRSVAFRVGGDGRLVELGLLPWTVSSRAYGINAHGHVVGEAVDVFGVARAFVADDQGLRSVGTIPGGGGSVARAINDDGLIVGHATDASGREMAFVGRPGQLMALGLLPGGRSSFALGVNNHGAVVGQVAGSSGSRAFLWTAEEGMIDLNQRLEPGSGWVLQVASGINDAGMIVGTGLKDGVTRAFLLRPTSWGAPGPGDGPGPVGPPDPGAAPPAGPHYHATPEPGSLLLVVCGAVGAGSWGLARRRRGRPPLRSG